MAKQRAIKVGDKVRVGSESDSAGRIHGIKFGAVAVVTANHGDFLRVRGPVVEDGWSEIQTVLTSKCKLAKQAMKVKA